MSQPSVLTPGQDPSGQTGQVSEQLSKPRPGDLLRLTSLRAFAAVLVCGYHVGHDHVLNQTGPFRVGDSGVSFFFILSGFVLAWSTPIGMGKLEFFRRRLARIYPSYILLLVVSIALPVVPVGRGVEAAVLNVFLVQAWSTRNSITFGMNAVSWSLSCEIAFYVAFPFVLRRLRAISPRKRWTIACIYVAAEGILAIIAVAGHHATLAGICFQNPLVRFGEFLLGMVAAIEVRRGWRLGLAPSAAILAASLIATAILTTSILHLPPATADKPLDTIYLIPAYFVIVVWAAGRDVATKGGWLRWRPLVYAGQVSFAFYLVHELVLVNLRHEWGGGLLIAALALVISAVAAIAVHHAVELPFQRIIRRTPRRAPPPSAASLRQVLRRPEVQDATHHSEGVRQTLLLELPDGASQTLPLGLE